MAEGQDGEGLTFTLDVDEILDHRPPPHHTNESVVDDFDPNSPTISPVTHLCPVQQVAPTFSLGAERNWKLNIGSFKSKLKNADGRSTEETGNGLPSQRKARGLKSKSEKYYKQQNETVAIFESIENETHDEDEDDIDSEGGTKKKWYQLTSRQAAILSLSVNFCLLVAKVVASVMSGSLSVISSLVDSALDLFSGSVLWYTHRQMSKRDKYKYPVGKLRFEPIAILIIATVMGSAAFQIILRAIEDLAASSANPKVKWVTIILFFCIIGAKIALFLICRPINSPSAKALATDHLNDVVSNGIALLMGYLGYKYWKGLDPIGAIILSLYIIYNWSRQGLEHVQNLAGKAADPEFLKKLTWTACNHDERIRQVDTVRAFHFGNNYLVEVDIVLDSHLPLEAAHEIGQTLQNKLEKFSDVERAFVHLDVETEHDAEEEHKAL